MKDIVSTIGILAINIHFKRFRIGITQLEK